MKNYLNNILQAPVYDVAIESELEKITKLSKKLSNQIFLKREDTQPIFSFKCRGAYNKMYSLDEQERQRGVIACSAGNHAQGVALAANKLAINAKIIMPKTTPSIKVEAVKNFACQTILYGDNFDETSAYTQQLIEQENRVFISPFDDEHTIVGQGTIAMEIIRQCAGALPDKIFVPVGGGGLISGIVAFLQPIAPQIKVIGVEPEDSACLSAAIKAKKRISLNTVGLFADGVAVKQIGEKPWQILKNTVDEVITVSTDEICAAIKDSFEATRVLAEPSGALALAGLKKKVQQDNITNEKLIAILSGANTNFNRLQYIVERSEVGEQKEALFAVTIPEKPGSFLKFCKSLGKTSISEFNYRYSDKNEAHIYVGILINDGEQKNKIAQKLSENNFPLTDLSDDELSKNHIRHMVGGRVKGLENEKIYRFIFPERPGALTDFLNIISKQWNISLFHYRNHGAAYGRVLAGLQISDKEQKTFENIISNWDQNFIEETQNTAYQLFLR